MPMGALGEIQAREELGCGALFALRRQIASSLGLLLFCSANVLAQQATPATEQDFKSQRERTLAISIIEQTVLEAPLWDDKTFAVTVLAEAADLRWDQSAASARSWLLKAWELIDSVSDEPRDPNLKVFSTRSNKTELRSVVLRVAHNHDAKLADSLIKGLETEDSRDEKKERGAFDDRTARSEQLLALAQQLSSTNPELAFALAERSLADGISFTLQNVLTTLRRKNVDLSNRLFDLALARFSSTLPDPSEAEVLSGYLFQPGLTFSTNSSGLVIMSMNPAQRNDPVVAQAEPPRARAFLVAAYQAFMSRPMQIEGVDNRARAQKVWAFASRNINRYVAYATEFAGPVRNFLTQLQAQLFPEGRGDPFSSNRSNVGDSKPKTDREIYEARLAELEELADKEPNPTAKKQAYVNVVLAVEATDYERAKRIAEKIADEDLRVDVISYAIYRAALAFVTQKDSGKAQELAEKLTNRQRQAMVKIAIAQHLLAGADEKKGEPTETVGNQQRAFDLLNDVAREMKKESPSDNAAKILLGRAALLAKLDKTQTLTSVEDALVVINKLDRFDLRDFSPPGLGLTVAPRSQSLLDTPRLGFSFRQAVETLVKTEFESLADLAGRFTRKEVRGLARFEVAKLYLQLNK